LALLPVAPVCLAWLPPVTFSLITPQWAQALA
jgi:hypothetical protein